MKPPLAAPFEGMHDVGHRDEWKKLLSIEMNGKKLRPAVAVICIVVAFVAMVASLLRYRTRNMEICWVLANIAVASREYQRECGQWPMDVVALTNNPRRSYSLYGNVVTSDAWRKPMVYEPYSEERGFGSVKSQVIGIECRFGPNDLHEFRQLTQQDGTVEAQHGVGR